MTSNSKYVYNREFIIHISYLARAKIDHLRLISFNLYQNHATSFNIKQSNLFGLIGLVYGHYCMIGNSGYRKIS